MAFVNSSFLMSCDNRCNYLTSEHLDKTWDVHVASSPYYLRQDKYHHEMLLENIEKADACVEEAKKIRAAIHLVHLKVRNTQSRRYARMCTGKQNFSTSGGLNADVQRMLSAGL